MTFTKNMTTSLFIFAMLILAPLVASAHQGHHHHTDTEATTPVIQKENTAGVTAIREDYERRIKSIFQNACMDCHSAQTRFPWYHKIPGIKQMLDSDIREARHHLDFSDGYPFKSHATPMEDLDAIAESIQKNTMPPFFYRFMHPKNALKEVEKKSIFDWIEKSKLLLKKDFP